jgi:K(+)-stimulated pyrophosphate-energized sodium pump
MLGLAGAAKWLLGTHWLPFFACGTIGIAAGIGMLFITQYYTEHRYRPIRELAELARGGPSLAILSGFARALESSVPPFALAAATALGAYYLGSATHLAGGGLFGTAIATMGMLGTAGYVLAMDAFGAIVDNAGGIVEMTVARERPDVRGRTLVLDGVGNTVKNLAKTYAGGAAVVGSMLLLAGYLAEVRDLALSPAPATPSFAFRVDTPELYVGAFFGILLVFWFAARSIVGVTRSARRLIDEVRRQLRNLAPALAPNPRASDATRAGRGSGPGENRSSRPLNVDYDACVDIATQLSLREMLTPALVAVIAPIAVGLALRLARTEDNPIVAADSVAAFVVAGTIAGILGSLLLGNAGGAWDNAKKYIVTGAHGGRYLIDETGNREENPTYGAAAVGDGVGDPLKDTAGPALHVLAKMLNVIALVFLPFFL